MESEEWADQGGRSGKLWDSTAADLGLMMQRDPSFLPRQKHMPPKGNQLTDEEVEILAAWLKAGADFKPDSRSSGRTFSVKLAGRPFWNDSGERIHEFEPRQVKSSVD